MSTTCSYLPIELPRHASLALFLLLALLLSLGSACVVELDASEEDPAGALADVEEEWLDEGPLPEDEEPDQEVPEDALSLAAAPRFQLPFPCHQVWAGQTRTGHSPKPSVDFNRFNDFGDLVVASAGGTVVRVEHIVGASYGRWIEIAHGGGYRTRYAHLSGYRVSVGQKVKQGQILGRVGNSGGSQGAHLHYEQRRNGVAVRAKFNGNTAPYYGTKNYRSHNCN